MSSEITTPESEAESESDSSTVVYDHEPFETFKARVLELCQIVLAPSNGEILIGRMQGGGFNRIIGVSLTRSESPAVSQYILRIPRFEVEQLDHDLAPHQLLRHRSKIKIPDVVTFDTTGRNALESPYMIQTRIPGSSPFPGYPDIPHGLRCATSKELGESLFELHSIRSTTAGRLTLYSSQGLLMIQLFNNTWTDATVPYENGSAAQTTSEMLRTILEHKESWLQQRSKSIIQGFVLRLLYYNDIRDERPCGAG